MPADADPSIVQIGMHFDPSKGGADRYFCELLRALDGAGVGCRAAAFGEPPAEGLHERTSLGPDGASLPARLMALRRYGREVVRSVDAPVFAWHFALYGGAALPGWPGRRGCPVGGVAHFHGPWGDESAAEGAPWPVVMAKRWIERRVLRRAHRVIVLSKAFGDLAVGRLGVSPERIAVVPPSMDCSRFQPTDKVAARRALGWPESGPLVFCLRRLVHRMGLEELLAAWARVAAQFPDATLVLGGTGPLLPRLQAQAAAMGSAGTAQGILFAGRLSEEALPLAFSAATVSVVPSRSLEGFGLVALESMACGTPTLVTPVGGLPEAVSGLDPALVLPASDGESLAAGLTRALASPEALPDASACRKFVEENFTPKQLAARVLAVYNEARKESREE